MVEVDDIELLIELAKKHGLSELYVQQSADRSIRVKLPTSTDAVLATSLVSAEKKSLTPSTQHMNCVKAPMVGTVYLSSNPDEPPYVTSGKKVKKGDILCLIEAMKMFNKILADRDGTIQSVLVDDASGVAFDTPLFSWQD